MTQGTDDTSLRLVRSNKHNGNIHQLGREEGTKDKFQQVNIHKVYDHFQHLYTWNTIGREGKKGGGRRMNDVRERDGRKEESGFGGDEAEVKWTEMEEESKTITMEMAKIIIMKVMRHIIGCRKK